MDDYDRIENKEEVNEQEEIGHYSTYDGDVSKPIGFRYSICDDNEGNRFVLDYHRYFLPAVTILLWLIFIFT
jgi:hypothetical protein